MSFPPNFPRCIRLDKEDSNKKIFRKNTSNLNYIFWNNYIDDFNIVKSDIQSSYLKIDEFALCLSIRSNPILKRKGYLFHFRLIYFTKFGE